MAARPRCFTFENVRNLAESRHAEVRHAVVLVPRVTHTRERIIVPGRCGHTNHNGVICLPLSTRTGIAIPSLRRVCAQPVHGPSTASRLWATPVESTLIRQAEELHVTKPDQTVL